MRFSSDYQPANRGRKRGSRNKLNRLIDEAAPQILQRVIDQALNGDNASANLLLARAIPPLKPVGAGLEITGNPESFGELATVLNNAGITCPVTINVRDGVYDDKFVVANVLGNSLTNTITIQGESGDSSLVTLEHEDGVTYKFIELNNVAGFTFRHMNIQFKTSASSSSADPFSFNNCDSLRIVNCDFNSLYQYNNGTVTNSGSSNNQFTQLSITDCHGVLIENNANLNILNWQHFYYIVLAFAELLPLYYRCLEHKLFEFYFLPYCIWPLIGEKLPL